MCVTFEKDAIFFAFKKLLRYCTASRKQSNGVSRFQASCAQYCASAELRRALPRLLPPLAACAAAPAAEVRKAAVDAFVELYVALGDALVPQLKSLLREDQLKLVNLYVHKRNKHRE